MVTGHKDAKGDFHPHTGSKSGVSENDIKISVTGNNDVIKIQPKKPVGKNIDELHKKWSTTMGFRDNKFSSKSQMELRRDLEMHRNNIRIYEHQLEKYGPNAQVKEDIENNKKLLKEKEEELKIREKENDLLEERIKQHDNLLNEELLEMRRSTLDPVDYSAAINVLRKRGLWKGSNKETETFLRGKLLEPIFIEREIKARTDRHNKIYKEKDRNSGKEVWVLEEVAMPTQNRGSQVMKKAIFATEQDAADFAKSNLW